MIKQEQIEINGRTLTKTYSDAGKYIIQEQTGHKYEEAIDILTTYTYIESIEDLPEHINPEAEVAQEQGNEEQENQEQGGE